jgi:hypothetical protein
MILEELDELVKFITKESGCPAVSLVIGQGVTGFRILVDHGTEEYIRDSNILRVRVPIYVTVISDIKDWRRVLKTTEIIQKEIRIQKKNKYDVRAWEREDSDSEYRLRLEVSLPLPV